MTIMRLSFDPINKSRLFTNTGVLDLDIHSIADEPITEASSLGFVRRGYGISTDYKWITKDGNRMLWLPAECRAQALVVTESIVAIVNRSNRVMMMQFS